LWTCLGLSLAGMGVAVWSQAWTAPAGAGVLVPPIFAVLAVAGLARRLPAQNVVAVAALLVLAGGAVEWISARTDFPLGPRRFGPAAGEPAPWPMPWPRWFWWLGAVLTVRGVARLILRPARSHAWYGFLVLGLAGLLAGLTAVLIEPVASDVLGWWRWDMRPGAAASAEIPWLVGMPNMMVALLLQAVATPWLLNKRPVLQPTDWAPLWIWCAGFALLCGAAAQAGRLRWALAEASVGTGVALAAVWAGRYRKAVAPAVTRSLPEAF
jgi:hypothetical protein